MHGESRTCESNVTHARH